MTSSFATTQAVWQQSMIRPARRSRTKLLKVRIRLGSVSLMFALVILMALLGGGIIQRTHYNSVRGYEIEKLYKQNTELNTENEVLNRQIAEVLSLKKIEETPVVQSMQKAVNYKTVTLGTTQVAWNQ